MLDLRYAPSVAVVEQKTALVTRRVLAQVALCAAVRFPAFDDLLAVIVRALDRDEGHGPLFAFGRWQDEVQCDINLSPSPLLEHYPFKISLKSNQMNYSFVNMLCSCPMPKILKKNTKAIVLRFRSIKKPCNLKSYSIYNVTVVQISSITEANFPRSIALF